MGQTALLSFRRKACWGFFFALKNPTASAEFEPANLGTKCQQATSRPPKLLPYVHIIYIYFQTSVPLSYSFIHYIQSHIKYTQTVQFCSLLQWVACFNEISPFILFHLLFKISSLHLCFGLCFKNDVSLSSHMYNISFLPHRFCVKVNATSQDVVI